MARPSILPPELIDMVFDHVDAVDRDQVVSTCSQVDSVFRGVAQKRIFREITISFDTYGRHFSNAESLSDIISKNHSLASFVHSLILRLGNLELASQYPSLLRAFPHLTQVTLTSRSDYVGWERMPTSIHDALLFLLKQPSVEFLAMQRQVQFPINILSNIPHIKRLSIESSSILSPTSLPRSTSLHTFTAVIYGDNEESVGAVNTSLKVFAPSLVNVGLDCHLYDTSPLGTRGAVSFAGATRLRSLKLLLRIQHTTAQLIAYTQALQTLESKANKDIGLELWIRFLRPIDGLYRPHWSTLDRALCEMLDKSAIRSLRVVLSAFISDDEGLAEVKNAMVGLDSRLCIQCDSDSDAGTYEVQFESPITF
ncbi:hypothetical protein H0H92_012430 [Tricholoma furcatifolium]|nr:hypothetical protein H0H92_012430 [Tricholoma furcatifolium]